MAEAAAVVAAAGHQAIVPTATVTQQLRVKSAFADAGPAHEQATVFAAQMYLESMGQAADAQAVTTYDIALNWFGSVMPPATLPNNPAPNVKEIIREVLAIYRAPGTQGAPEPQATAGATGVNVVVSTAEDRAKEARTVRVATFKFPRHAQEPYTCLYLHRWVEILASAGQTVAFDSWSRQMGMLFQGFSIPPTHTAKYQRLVRLVATTLTLLLEKYPGAEVARLENIAKPWLDLWSNTVEQIVEIWLLSGTFLQSSPAAATAKFSATVDKQWNTGEIDYYAAIVEAKEFKSAQPTPKNSLLRGDPFRRGNT